MRLLLSALSCNPAVGSEALVGFKYAEALSQRYDVMVVTSPPSQTPNGAELRSCDAGPCSFNEITAPPLLRFEMRQLRMARRLRSSFDFDLVHRVTPGSINLPTWTFRLGKPLVVGPIIAAEPPPKSFSALLKRPFTRPAYPRWHPTRLLARLCRAFVNRAGRKATHLHRASRILVGTRTAASLLPDACQAKSRFITYSGVEHDLFVPSTDNHQPSTVVRLLFVGRLVPYKGLELLIHAFARAAKKTALHLSLVGNADALYLDYLCQLARDLGLTVLDNSQHAPVLHSSFDEGGTRNTQHATRASSISFLTPVPRNQLLAVYQQADIFCFPTLCDTYGIALLEAMSCGCAPIVSDVAGAGEIVNGENGLKVPLENPEQYIAAFAENIVSLARNPEQRARLGAAARKYILTQHDWSRIRAQLFDIYDELVPALSKP